MKKIFSKVAILTLGVALAAGAGVALSFHKEAMGVAAEDPVSETLVSNSSSTYYKSGYIVGVLGADNATWTGSHFTAVQEKNTSSSAVVVSYAEIRVYANHSFTITPEEGYQIDSIAMVATTNAYATAVGGKSLTNCSKSVSAANVTLTPNDGTAAVAFANSAQSRLKTITVTTSPTGGVVKTDTVTTISNPSGKTTLDLAIGDDAVQLSASVTANETPIVGAQFTWSTSDPTVATVSGGLVTPVAIGKVTITAAYAGSDTYKGSNDTIDINVKQSVFANYYSLVTSTDELYEGGKYIFASPDAGETVDVMSIVQNKSNRGTANVDVVDGLLSISDTAPQVVTLGLSDDLYTFAVSGGYLYASSSSSNEMKTEATVDNNAKWTISITEGVATITAQGTNEKNIMNYNPNGDNPAIFSCYASTSSIQNRVAIYRLNFEETLLKTITCDGQGSHSFIPGTSWNNLKTTFEALSATEKTAMVTASNAGLERYDYLIAKYGTAVYENFIGRTITPLAQSLVGEGEGASFNTTALITVVAAIALTSVAGIVTVIIIRRRRFHN